MSEDESVSNYNERVLEIANESLLLGEKIPKSKIVGKILQSLQGKFDMKVTAIEEAHDITKLKLDELFGSLLTFEITISHKEDKKGKGIAFKPIYEEETTVNLSDNVANMNESIALLTKQFSKVVKKFKNLNTTGSNAQNLTNYRRKDDENNTRRYNKVSNKRESDFGRKKESEGRFFRCREYEDTDDSEEDNGMNAFTVRVTEIDSGDESESSEENCDNELTFEELKVLWEEDSEARAIQKERIQDLMEEHERLMSVISSLKLTLEEVHN
ncbi:gag-pol polyprotein [Cucumis melo var. makuwa]|uniref:Gag-pol polyprotein n=1 Tax=Cucumis melo var. makuwa TaxID=1194695 RepID=A0A5D3BN48_CUCMM|nr:gag-pol polyprotein [Cucumis melo var. makuwa]TYK00684.1 gag-pol polyprotein [Cucumis melo var. makuwa]